MTSSDSSSQHMRPLSKFADAHEAPVELRKKSIHFVGICGTAMGAVAAAMKEQGWNVTGSDAAPYPPISDFLASRQIPIATGFHPDNLPKEEALIVVGNAISRGNPELEAVLNKKLLYTSLPELLRTHFLQGRHNLVVTGTHGKTTTSSMLAWIFEAAQKNPSYLIGGIPHNLGQGACFRDPATSPYVILEGDEYDTAFFDKRSKFLHYLPELVIINNIEFDHADIFANLDEIKLSFRRLLKIVPSEGMILINGDDPNARDVALEATTPVVEVGFSENCGHRIHEAWQKEGHSEFQLLGEKFEIAMSGEHNIRNAAMAAAAAHFYGIPLTTIREALLAFQGVKRRQEIIGVVDGVTLIDDFGHHPTAIRQTLAGLQKRYAGAKLWAVFEPRSNTSRRAVFQEILPEAFSLATGVIVGAIARATQISSEERLNPERLVADLVAAGKPAFYEPITDQIVTKLHSVTRPGDVIIIFSNGSFDGLTKKLINGRRSEG